MKVCGKIFVSALLCFMLCGAVCVQSAEAADKIRLGVMEFQSKADGISDREAQIITDIFTRTLSNSKTISVFERVALQNIGEEQKLGMSGLVDESTAVEIGKIAGLQYILLGAVTELSEKASGGFIPIAGIGLGSGKHEARATLDVRVIDVATSEIRLSLSESGHSTNSSQGFSIAGLTFAESEFGGLQARAIADAASRLGHVLRENLGGEYTYVVSANDSDYTIDAGSTMGVQEGSLYLVYADGKSILDMSNNVIGREEIPLAVLKVRDTSTAHSVCVLAPPSKGSLIQRGDKIRPITAPKAKGVKFASNRPAASSGTFEEIFGSGEGTETVSAPGGEQQAVIGQAEVAQAEVPQPEAQQTAAQPAAPASQPAEQKVIEGFDPNQSTDSKVITTYPLPSGTINILGIKQRNAYNKFNSRRYKDAYAEFCALVDEYDGNYLSAYWAGRAAQGLRNNEDAAAWFDRAIQINPNYQPAIDAREKMK